MNNELDRGIETLELTTRTFNVLHRGGISTVAELLRLDPETLLGMRGMNPEQVPPLLEIMAQIAPQGREVENPAPETNTVES